jgi:hypothetical protein
MKKGNEDAFQFFYDEAGEKEIMDQMTNAYQSGFENTVEQENDSQYEGPR